MSSPEEIALKNNHYYYYYMRNLNGNRFVQTRLTISEQHRIQ